MRYAVILCPTIQVVAIVGTQRGGKSSLLNMLFNRQMEGFGLGHYMDPQTDGLWMWIREHPQKPGLRVMYLDTEGAVAGHVFPLPPWQAGTSPRRASRPISPPSV